MSGADRYPYPYPIPIPIPIPIVIVIRPLFTTVNTHLTNLCYDLSTVKASYWLNI